MAKSKFKVGDRVQVKTSLTVGMRYYMDDTLVCLVFQESMAHLKGKQAQIMSVDEKGRGYTVDIDNNYFLTDEMLIKVTDAMAKKPDINDHDVKEINALLEHMLKLAPEQQINYALDTGNKELFYKLTGGEKVK